MPLHKGRQTIVGASIVSDLLRHGYTLKSVASLTGISAVTLGKIHKGKAWIPPGKDKVLATLWVGSFRVTKEQEKPFTKLQRRFHKWGVPPKYSKRTRFGIEHIHTTSRYDLPQLRYQLILKGVFEHEKTLQRMVAEGQSRAYGKMLFKQMFDIAVKSCQAQLGGSGWRLIYVIRIRIVRMLYEPEHK